MIQSLLYIAHLSFMFMLSFILLFSTNYYVLGFGCIVLLLTLHINYKIEDCPISKIEDMYSDLDCLQFITRIFVPTKYNSKKYRPLIILNMLWISLLFITNKILVLCTIKIVKSLFVV